jgi:hypothetical protein
LVQVEQNEAVEGPVEVLVAIEKALARIEEEPEDT